MICFLPKVPPPERYRPTAYLRALHHEPSCRFDRVPSACSTGEGRALRGEGIMSLSRGFIYAGCPSIVMSLWKAADDGTQKIMVHFYQALLQHTGKDIALQQAKLQYLSNADQITAHPFYWATFVLLGNPNAMKQGRTGGIGSYYSSLWEV